MMQTRSRSRSAVYEKIVSSSSLTKEEDAGKKSSASSSSQRIEVPYQLCMVAGRARKWEEKVKACPSDEDAVDKLAYYEEQIDTYAELYKARGHLPPDWEYRPDTFSNWVPVTYNLLSPNHIIKMNIPLNPHIQRAQLDKEARLKWKKFLKIDRQLETKSLAGLPCPMDEKLLTPLEKDTEFVTYMLNFAVGVFNESCQMYCSEENKNNIISRAKLERCNYLKFLSCFVFYIDMKAFQQKKSGRYEINIRCDLRDGSIVLDSFCHKGSEPFGTREWDFINLESIYETKKADSLTDPEVSYHKSGMVRRTNGYDFYNPRGWDSLWDCDAC